MQDHSESQSSPLPRGASAYSRFSLRGYDFLVHSLSNRFAWNCPTSALIAGIRANLTPNHLEIGIGTGKLLRKAIRGRSLERLVLADVNPECLAYAKKVLAPWHPQLWTFDLLELRNSGGELPGGQGRSRFTSIGLNYVLHCLPCPLEDKLKIVVELVDRLLDSQGVLFGSVIFPDLQGNAFSRWLMRFYNRKGIFGNEHDRASDFQTGLRKHGLDCQFETRGCVVLFTARRPSEAREPMPKKRRLPESPADEPAGS